MTTKTDILQIKLETSGDGKVKASIAGIGNSVGKLDKKSQQAEKSSLGLATALKGVAAGYAIFKTGELVGGLISINKEFDSLHASLTTVTGSAANADKAFNGIQEFSSTTPYQLNEVTNAFIKLKALGLDPSDAALRSYGNTASGMGKSLNDMIEAVADATTGEFERLKEFGIKASVQGDQVSLRFRGITTKIGNNAGEIEGYLRRIGDVEFAGGMARQMDTLGGGFSNLEDATSRFARAIGEGSGFNDALKSGTHWLTEFLNAATEAFSPVNNSGDWLDVQGRRVDELAERLKQAEEDLLTEQGDRFTLPWEKPFEERIAIAQAKIEALKNLIIATSAQINETAKLPDPGGVSSDGTQGSEPTKPVPVNTAGYAEAEALTRSLYTAQETLGDELLRLNGQWQAGYLSVETYGLAVAAAKKNFDDATDSGAGYIELMAQGEQIIRDMQTPQEAFADEVLRLNGLWQAGAIDVETYGRAILDAQQAIVDDAQDKSLQWSDAWSSAGNRFAASLGDAVANSILEQKNFADTMRAVARGVVQSVISGLVEIGVKKLLLAGAEKAALAAQTGAVVGSAAIIGTAMATPAALSSLATLGSNAVPAAAGIASTVALSESLALAGIAHSGLDYVPREGTYLLQQGEMVLDAGTSNSVRNAAQGGGGQPVVVNMPINANAIDSRGIVGLLKSNRGLIGSIAIRAVNEAMNARGQRGVG